MVIFIKRENKEGNVPEWAIIELQGDLQSRSDGPLYGEFVGDLHYSTTGQPILIIGHHLLQGKEMDLEKPFALLEKKRDETEIVYDKSQTQKSQMNTAYADEHTDPSTEYIVKALIKKKLVFKSRPKPIILNVSNTL